MSAGKVEVVSPSEMSNDVLAEAMGVEIFGLLPTNPPSFIIKARMPTEEIKFIPGDIISEDLEPVTVTHRPYPTDIAAAMEVIPRMLTEFKVRCEMEFWSPGLGQCWRITFYDQSGELVGQAVADSFADGGWDHVNQGLPRAICEAALLWARARA
jgi:hypothetical protein